MPLLSIAVTDREKATDTVIDGALAVLQSANQILSLIPCAPPGIDTAIDCLTKIVQTIKDARKNRKDAQGLCEKMLELANAIARMAQAIQLGLDKFKSDPTARAQYEQNIQMSRDLVDRVVALHSKLNGVADKTGKILKRSWGGRLWHSKDDAETLTDLEKQLAEAISMFQMRGSFTIEQRVNEIVMSVEIMQKEMQRERYLQLIPKVDIAQYGAGIHALKSRFEKDTRTDVMDLLKGWAKQASGSAPPHPICLLIGEAGIGKSTIVVEFCEYLKGSDHGLGASWLFNKDTQELSTAEVLFSSIASQLAASQSQLHDLVADAAGEYLKAGSIQQPKDQFERLLQGPLSALPSSHPPIFVVIDALDECTVNGHIHIPIILNLLLPYATQEGCPLRIVLASRPTPQYIHDYFSEEDLQSRIYTLSLSDFSGSAREDVAKLIRDNLMHLHPTSEQWSGSVDRLVYKARGYFLYARAALDFMLEGKDSPEMLRERLDALLDASESLNPLDQLYHTVLETLFAAAHKKMRERIPLLLGYTVSISDYANMSPKILEGLTATSGAEISFPATESMPIFNRLRSIVSFEYNNPDSPIRIVHTSFREFLADRSRCGDKYYIDMALAHWRLRKACLDTCKAFRTKHWAHDTGAKLVLRLLTEEAPQLEESFQYAAYSYARHSSESKSLDADMLRRLPGNHSLPEEDDVPSSKDICLYMEYPTVSSDNVYYMAGGVLLRSGNNMRSMPHGWDGVVRSLSYLYKSQAVRVFKTVSCGRTEEALAVAILCVILDMQTISAAVKSGKASISMEPVAFDFATLEEGSQDEQPVLEAAVLNSLKTLELAIPVSNPFDTDTADSDHSTEDADTLSGWRDRVIDWM